MNRFGKEQLGIAVLRVVVGAVMLAHGSQKLFVTGIPAVAQSFAHMGIPMPEISAVLCITAEFLGGLALVLGLATRWVAAVVAFDMAVAAFGVHMKHGFFAPAGMEFPFTLMVANIALVLTGSGAFALDRLMMRRRGMDQRHRSPLAA